jgi:alkaline phosphatase D
VKDPVVQVFEEPSGELVYAFRLKGDTFRPHVFAAGTYTLKIGDPDTGRWKTLSAVPAVAYQTATLEVRV